MVQVNWEKLREPGETLTLTVPTRGHIEMIGDYMKSGFLCIPDGHRSDAAIAHLLNYLFPRPDVSAIGAPVHAIYKIKDFDGIVCFCDIEYGYSTAVKFVLWNTRAFNHKLLRDLIKVHRDIMTQFALKRVAFSTPHNLHVGIFRKIGYKVEGRQKYGFKWDNKLFTNHLMRMVREA